MLRLNAVPALICVALICLQVPCQRASGAEPERFELENGLRVILRPISTAKNVAIITLYSIGGDHDPEGRSGIAHLTEHVYVTGRAGSTPARTGVEYSRRYPDGWNAQTGARYTVFAAVFPSDALEDELRDAADRMGDLTIGLGDLAREKPRLVAELGRMFETVPVLAAFSNASERAQPSPLGGRKAGLPDHVNAVTVGELQGRWLRYYKPRNAILVLAGGFETATARQLINEHFTDIPSGEPTPPPYPQDEPRLGGTDEIRVKPAQKEASGRVCVAYRAPYPDDDLYPAFLILAARLTSNTHKLPVEEGPSTVTFTPLDYPEVIAVTVPGAAGETSAETVERLRDFVAETIERDLEPFDATTTKDAFGLLLGLTEIPDRVLAKNPYGVAFSLARRAQLGIDPESLAEAVEAVTDADLRRAAKQVFAPERSAAVAVIVIPEETS
jgi:zinc protease